MRRLTAAGFLAALLLGALFLPYLFVIEAALGHQALSHDHYLRLLALHHLLCAPGNLLSLGIVHSSELSSPHLTGSAFWYTLAALTVANVVGWYLVLVLLRVGTRRLLKALGRSLEDPAGAG